jgi:two-component system, response regulator
MCAALILYVENSPEDIELAELMFRQLNVSNPLQFVRSGPEALDYLHGRGQFADRKKYPFPGVVLLDISMPELDGFEVLALIREEEAFLHLPVFMFSNFDEPEDRARAKQLGAHGYMTKTTSYKSFSGWLEDVNDCLESAKNPGTVIQFGEK